MVRAQGIDVHSPAVLRVVQASLPASHGRAHVSEDRGGAQRCRQLSMSCKVGRYVVDHFFQPLD
jgi:hypothetical protein